MTSHFSALGFQVETEADLAALAEHAVHAGQVVAVPGGAYVRWAPGNGVELWLQVTQASGHAIDGDDAQVIGVTPFFHADSRLVLGLVEALPTPDETPMDGAYRVIAAPDEQHLDGGAGFVLDLADARRYHDLPVPVRVEAVLAGFAHQLVGYPSESAWRATQPEFKLSVGRFDALAPAPDAPEGAPPPAMVRWTGQVLAAETRKNPFTGQPFEWARLRVPGAEVEIVADPALRDGTPLQPGGVADGVFWVCGRILRTV
jgi:hypothetical protein